MRAGGARLLPITIPTITYNVVVYAPAEWACRYTPPISTLPLYVLCGQYQFCKNLHTLCYKMKHKKLLFHSKYIVIIVNKISKPCSVRRHAHFLFDVHKLFCMNAEFFSTLISSSRSIARRICGWRKMLQVGDALHVTDGQIYLSHAYSQQTSKDKQIRLKLSQPWQGQCSPVTAHTTPQHKAWQFLLFNRRSYCTSACVNPSPLYVTCSYIQESWYMALYIVKKVSIFPVSSRDVTYQALPDGE